MVRDGHLQSQLQQRASIVQYIRLILALSRQNFHFRRIVCSDFSTKPKEEQYVFHSLIAAFEKITAKGKFEFPAIFPFNGQILQDDPLLRYLNNGVLDQGDEGRSLG